MTTSLPSLFYLGDSISLQAMPYLQPMVAHLCDLACKGGRDKALLNLDNPSGANGGNSQMVREFLESQIPSHWTASHLLLNCGLHDIKRDPGNGTIAIPPDQYHDNLEAIFQLVNNHGIKLAWVRTTPAFEDIHNRPQNLFHRFAADVTEYNGIADHLCQSHAIPTVDLHNFTLSLAPKDELFCDHVHYPHPIRRLQAAYLTGFIESWLAKSQ